MIDRLRVLAAAGPRTALQLVRDPGDSPRRYQVRLLQDGAWLELHAGPTYAPAAEVFDLEAYWRAWTAEGQEGAA